MATYGQQGPMNMHTVPVMAQQPIRPNTTRPGFAHHSQNRLGILQLVCGMLVCVIAVAMIFLESALFFLGYGIWTGIFFILSGALAVSSAKSKNTCPIVGCLVMSVISMMAAVLLISFGSVGVIIDSTGCRDEIYYDDMCNDYQERMKKVGAILNGVNLLTGLFEFIVALVQMIVCSRALCCAPSQPGTIYYATASQQVQAQFSPQQQAPQQRCIYPQQQYAAQQYPQQYGQPYGQYPPAAGAYQPPGQYPEHQAAGYQPQPGAPPLYPQLPHQYDDAGRPPPYNPGVAGPSAPAPAYAEAPPLPTKH